MDENAIRLENESDEYEVTTVEAVPPTWRDVWAILRGRYQPKVRRRKVVTVKGMDRVLREVYSPQALEKMNERSPLADLLSSGQSPERGV